MSILKKTYKKSKTLFGLKSRLTHRKSRLGEQQMSFTNDLGYSGDKFLPPNFFEEVLDTEFRLKQRYNIQDIQKLITLYSKAVEYYEYLGDPRYIKYQNSLSLIFSQPEIKKYMNSGSSFKNAVKKVQFKKQLDSSGKEVTEVEVHNFIKSQDGEIKDNITKSISNEIDHQKKSFLERKEAKKKKYALSISDITGVVRNKMDDDDISVLSEWDNKSEYAHIETHDDENILLNTGNLLSDLKDEEIDFNLNEISSPSHKITTTNKTKFIENVQEKFNEYFKNFFDNFKNKNLDKLIDNYKECYEKLNKKLIDSQTNYIKQEKESLSLLIGNEDDEYKKQIDDMVKQLNEDREKEKNKFNKDYYDRLEKINKKFFDENINKNKDNEILQEKLKLELTNLLTENIK
jgi:hypothetical protein